MVIIYFITNNPIIIMVNGEIPTRKGRIFSDCPSNVVKIF